MVKAHMIESSVCLFSNFSEFSAGFSVAYCFSSHYYQIELSFILTPILLQFCQWSNFVLSNASILKVLKLNQTFQIQKVINICTNELQSLNLLRIEHTKKKANLALW